MVHATRATVSFPTQASKELSFRLTFVLQLHLTNRGINSSAVLLKSTCSTSVLHIASCTLLCCKLHTIQTFYFIIKAMTSLQLMFSTSLFCLQVSVLLEHIHALQTRFRWFILLSYHIPTKLKKSNFNFF